MISHFLNLFQFSEAYLQTKKFLTQRDLKGWHANTLCTPSCDRGQNESQAVSQRSSSVHKGPVGQDSTCQTNTTIDA